MPKAIVTIVCCLWVLACGGCMLGIPSRSAAEAFERFSVVDRHGRVVSFVASGPEGAPRVIFVHGTPGDASNFAAYLRDRSFGGSPADAVRAIAVDRPGFGASAGSGPVVSFQEQAAAIEPLLEERGGAWPVLVGHSLGGPIVARAAADFPDRVGAVVILAGSLSPDLEKPRWYNRLAGALGAALPRDLRTSNAEIMAARRETEALAAVLGGVVCPVFVLHGARDGLVAVGNAAYTRAALSGSDSVEVRVLDRAGHLLPWREEHEVRAMVGRAIGASSR